MGLLPVPERFVELELRRRSQGRLSAEELAWLTECWRDLMSSGRQADPLIDAWSERVERDETLPASARTVALKISGFASQSGQWWMSESDLGVRPATLDSAVQELVEAGWLEIVSRGANGSCRYEPAFPDDSECL